MSIDDLLKTEYRELFESLYPTEGERFSSKSQLIREMFDDIEKAKNNGVKLVSLHHVIKEKSGLTISYNEFKQILYRIRKERGAKPDKIETTKIAKPLSTSSHSQVPAINKSETTEITNMEKLSVDQFETGLEYWKALLKQFTNTKENVDRYVLLGGERKDIESESISEQRNMVTLLKVKLSNKYNK